MGTQFGQMIENIPVDLIGDGLYRLGFLVEYYLLCAGRFTVRAAIAIWKYAGSLLRVIVHPFWRGIATVVGDLLRPFLQLFHDVRHLRALTNEAEGQSEDRIRSDRRRYMRRSRTVYWRLILNVLAYIPPLAAAALLVFVVRRGTQLDFVLEVQVDGETVGAVQSEQVFDNARADVQSRFTNAREALAAAGRDEDAQLDVTPVYTLSIGNATMNEAEIADAIMRVSGTEIGQGTAIYVDGVLQFVTTEGDHLRTYLKNVKAPYENPLDANTHVTFSHDIELVDGVYILSSVEEYGDVISAFNADKETYYYTAGANETARTAVTNTGVSWESLAQMNPELGSLDQQIPEGAQLITGASSPEWLKVQVVQRQSYTEEIAYETETRTSNAYTFGREVVEQEGQPGEQLITQDVTYVDGQVVNVQTVSIEVLREPVKKIVVRGTRLDSGMVAKLGTGSFMWPVPASNKVSRWVRYYSSGGIDHKGADITGPLGTPIYAADSGYVTEARNGAGTSYWSYGIFVTIDHGNGYVTRYAHMSALAPGITEGTTVQQGQLIGYMGSTGRSSGSHCHFEIWYNGSIVNPKYLFPWVIEY